MNAAAIPAIFKDSDRWAIGRSKTPYIAGDSGKASSTDPSTWRPFAEALAAVNAGKGEALWYALDPESGIVAVDLDKCRDPESGVLLPFARAFVAMLDSYTEVSPSGTGVHVYLRATKPSDECKRGLVECYDRARFMSMTGDRLEGTPSTIEPRQAEIEAFFTLAFPPKQAAPAARETSTPAPVTLDDAELLKRMFGASNGAAIRALWEGSTTAHDGDDSSADLALTNHLAYWTGKDAARMDRLFRSSSLMRPKWDAPARHGETYGQGTIRTAIADCRTTYNPTFERQAAVKEAEAIVGEGADIVCIPKAEHERLVARDREFSRWRGETAALFRNPDLSAAEKLAHWALVNEFTWNGEPHKIRVKEFARRTGSSDRAVGRAIDRLSNPDDSGAPFRKNVTRERLETPLVNPKTGELVEWVSCIELAPKPKAAPDLLHAGATFSPKDRPEWGGAGRQRKACAKHPEAAVLATTALDCSVCHEPIGAPETVVRKPQSALNVQLVRSDAAPRSGARGRTPGVQDVHSDPPPPSPETDYGYDVPPNGVRSPWLLSFLTLGSARRWQSHVLCGIRIRQGAASWERFAAEHADKLPRVVEELRQLRQLQAVAP